MGIIGRHRRVERDVKKWRQRATEICHKMIIITIKNNSNTYKNNNYNDHNNDIHNNYKNNDIYDDFHNNR